METARLFCRQARRACGVEVYAVDRLPSCSDYACVGACRYIRDKYPTIRPLMWDDELRKMSQQELQASPLGKLVEPVVWKYTPSIDSFLPVDIWDKYATVFGSVWIASAFKGATGPDKITTDISEFCLLVSSRVNKTCKELFILCGNLRLFQKFQDEKI